MAYKAPKTFGLPLGKATAWTAAIAALALCALTAAALVLWVVMPMLSDSSGSVFSVKLSRASTGDAGLDGRADLSEISAMANDFVAVGADITDLDGSLTVTPKSAWEKNAARAFGARPVTAATSYASQLQGADLYRAESCLAAAALYEAGQSRDDQRPVMQVILNRVRHPAWPNSVCGVVFQGASRRTGCQFSFTCDGSMTRRRYSDAHYQSAKTLAATMLSGARDARVGWATHYHTDWVYPYWSDSLDKTAAVKTHIFFRWNGWWGTKAAFTARPASKEPAIASLASYDIWHEGGTADGVNDDTAQEDTAITVAQAFSAPLNQPIARSPTPTKAWTKPIVRPINAETKPGRWALDAVALCGSRTSCRVLGWSAGSAMPAEFDPESLRRNPPDIVYRQELRNRTQQVYWDCGKWEPAGTSKCLGSPSRAATLALLTR